MIPLAVCFIAPFAINTALEEVLKLCANAFSMIVVSTSLLKAAKKSEETSKYKVL